MHLECLRNQTTARSNHTDKLLHIDAEWQWGEWKYHAHPSSHDITVVAIHHTQSVHHAVRLARVFACSETTLQRGFPELGMMFRNTFGRWRCLLCGNWFWFSSQKSAHVDGSVRKAISPSKMLFAYVPFSRRKRSCSAKTQNLNPHRAFVIFYC